MIVDVKKLQYYIEILIINVVTIDIVVGPHPVLCISPELARRDGIKIPTSILSDE